MNSSMAAVKKKGEVSDDEAVKGWERLIGVARVSFTGSHRRRQLYLQKSTSKEY